jgi:hypothetical protein
MTQRTSGIQKSSGKLKCLSSSRFFVETNQKLVQSIWTERESLLLGVVIQVVQLADCYLSVKTIVEIFNTYGANFSDIRPKTQSQVAFKMSHLKKYKSICS